MVYQHLNGLSNVEINSFVNVQFSPFLMVYEPLLDYLMPKFYSFVSVWFGPFV